MAAMAAAAAGAGGNPYIGLMMDPVGTCMDAGAKVRKGIRDQLVGPDDYAEELVDAALSAEATMAIGGNAGKKFFFRICIHSGNDLATDNMGKANPYVQCVR
jgi:hypothetical protein